MALTPGKKLGPYVIVGPLGAGGMGEVLEKSGKPYTFSVSWGNPVLLTAETPEK